MINRDVNLDINRGVQRRENRVSPLKYLTTRFLLDGRIERRSFGDFDPSFLELVESYDCNQRFYVEYDPGLSEASLESSIVLRLRRLERGVQLEWSVDDDLRARTDYYVIFKTVNGERRLKKIIKGADLPAPIYAYADIATFTSNILNLSNPRYEVFAMDRRGRFFRRSNIAGLPSNIRRPENPVAEIAQNIEQYVSDETLRETRSALLDPFFEIT